MLLEMSKVQSPIASDDRLKPREADEDAGAAGAYRLLSDVVFIKRKGRLIGAKTYRLEVESCANGFEGVVRVGGFVKNGEAEGTVYVIFTSSQFETLANVLESDFDGAMVGIKEAKMARGVNGDTRVVMTVGRTLFETFFEGNEEEIRRAIEERK